jgi:lipid-A-disaccharide synthase-like uncharacterized protein
MAKNHTKHLSHFIALLAGLIIIALTITTLAFNPYYQGIGVVVLCLYYFFWGVIHHLLEKTLHPRIAVEYFFISLLGSIILLTVIFKA